MSNFQRILLACIIFAVISIPARSMQLIRFATLAPEGSTWMKIMRELDEEIREESGWELGFKFYPNMAMGDEKDVVRKIKLGQVHAAGFTGRGLGDILPELRILELPYLFNDNEELDFVTGKLEDYFEEKLAGKGFVLLGWANVGWVYFLSNKPVTEPTSLRRTKAWVWQGDPLAQVFYEALDKTPIPLPVTDVHLSLQTGLVNAVYCSPLAALVLQWFTNLQYISDVPFTNAIGAVLLDKREFDKLAPRLQQILLDRSEVKLKELLEQSRRDNTEAYEQLLLQGLEKVESSGEDREKMHQVGQVVHRELTGDLYPRELLDRLYRVLDEYRKKEKAAGSK